MKEIAGYTYDEWRKLEKEYQEDLEKSNRHIKSFQQLINEILDGETDMSFAHKTNLNPNMLYRLRHSTNAKNPPRLSTIISVCIGYDLNITLAQDLLRSLGLGFNPHKNRDCAYIFLLTRCRGKDIPNCNLILKELGLKDNELLGASTREKSH